MKASVEPQLITLVPSESLSFNLGKSVESKEVLRVTNSSNSKVAFKVKTTQPSWYYVRPNQQVLSPGMSYQIKSYQENSSFICIV